MFKRNYCFTTEELKLIEEIGKDEKLAQIVAKCANMLADKSYDKGLIVGGILTGTGAIIGVLLGLYIERKDDKKED